jgi:hypothetical protein
MSDADGEAGPLDAIDPVIETVLEQLWEAANEAGGNAA